MTNICAAIGLAQLEQADNFIFKKRKIAKIYKEHLTGLPLIVHQEQHDCYHTYWSVTILLNNSFDRNKLRRHLKYDGIETRPMFFPIHTMPMYKKKNIHHPISEALSPKGISLPSSASIDKKKIEIICNSIRNYFR